VPDDALDVSRLASVVVEAPCSRFDAALAEEGVFVVGWGICPLAVTCSIIVAVCLKRIRGYRQIAALSLAPYRKEARNSDVATSHQ